MTCFDECKQRQHFLKDKSIKGSIDERVLPIVELLNSHKDFYTTSSCSGRIVILDKEKDTKWDASWLLVSHEPFKDKTKILDIDFSKIFAWFIYESPIIHICAKDLDSAEKLIRIARDTGYKRAGYYSVRKRLIIEIVGTEKIDTPIAKDKLMVSEAYIDLLLSEANRKMEKNHQRLSRFTEAIRKGL